MRDLALRRGQVKRQQVTGTAMRLKLYRLHQSTTRFWPVAIRALHDHIALRGVHALLVEVNIMRKQQIVMDA